MSKQGSGSPAPRHRAADAELVQRCVIGFSGGLLGAFAMNLFSRAAAPAAHGCEAAGVDPGEDRTGHGVQPPQAENAAEDDATVRVGTSAYRAVAGSAPGRATRSRLGTAVHYAFGGAVGACYALIADRLPIIRAGRGTAYGTAVWLVADEMVMPALGLSRGPRQLPASVHAYALVGHWVYGLALDSAVRSAEAGAFCERSDEP